jgi:hypothetical protein
MFVDRCLSLFVWLLWCMSFVNLQILIIPLVPSSLSYDMMVWLRHLHLFKLFLVYDMLCSPCRWLNAFSLMEVKLITIYYCQSMLVFNWLLAKMVESTMCRSYILVKHDRCHWWSRNCLPFRNTRVHLMFFLGSLLLTSYFPSGWDRTDSSINI